MEIFKDNKGRFICGRKTKSGDPCGNPPGFKTPFIGKPGVPCLRHGGIAPKTLSSAAGLPPSSKDLTYHVIDEALKERADDFANDPDLMNLKREVGLCRARLELLEGDTDPETAMITSSLSTTIGKLVERIHKMEMERSGLVQIGLIRLLIDSWQKAIMEVIPDINLRNVLSKRMLDLSRSKLALIIEVPPSHQMNGVKESSAKVIEVSVEPYKD